MYVIKYTGNYLHTKKYKHIIEGENQRNKLVFEPYFSYYFYFMSGTPPHHKRCSLVTQTQTLWD